MIAIVNYGLGNVRAIANIYKRLNIVAAITSSAEELRAAKRIILPGVGAFDWAMGRLNDSGLRDLLDELVMRDGVPLLGICVGMQMLAKRSEEGVLPGLGWIDAEVRRFPQSQGLWAGCLPQMGWNDVRPVAADGLFQALGEGARFYFLHSYFVEPARNENVLAVTDYNGIYASAVRARNVYGVQFHPEKSHHWGVRLLRNFAELPQC